MTNSWSLLHDAMFGPEDEHNLTIYTNPPMNKDPNRYKYDEDAILKELSDIFPALITLTTPLVTTKFRHSI